MRLAIWILGASLALAGQAATLGCGSDGGSGSLEASCAEGEVCECRDYDTCYLDCEDTVPCEPSCLNFVDLCQATCMDDCSFDCRAGDRVDGRCQGSCGVNCDALCSSVGQCVVSAGADSNFFCLNAETCAATLEDGSEARCLDIGGTCQIKCKGTCQVLCESVGACNVDCDGQERNLCGPNFWVCGMECPAEMMAMPQMSLP
jgi:hypothetical protein